MDQVNNQWFLAAIVGFLIGAVIVWLFMRSGKNKNEEDIAALQKEYDDYRDNVNAHFAKTADAVDNLTKSYQDVFTHLSEGAETLMDKKALQAQLEKRQGKAVTLAYLVDEKNPDNNQSTPIDQQSVVKHQSSLDKSTSAQSATANTKASTKTNVDTSDKTDKSTIIVTPQTVKETADKSSGDQKIEATKEGRDAAQRANTHVKAKTTGQSVPVKPQTDDPTQAKAKQDTPHQTPKQPVRPQSQRATVNTTNQPAQANADKPDAKQTIKPQTQSTTVNTTNQPVPNQNASSKSSTDGTAKEVEGSGKTPAQEAALKAGLKPVPSHKKTEDAESAIDTVKRHIRDNNKTS